MNLGKLHIARKQKVGSGWNYEYFHKDHLGNTRVVFGYENIVDEYKTNLETTSLNGFSSLGARAQIQSMNHTPKSSQFPNPDWASETNGYLNKPIGPVSARLKRVLLPPLSPKGLASDPAAWKN